MSMYVGVVLTHRHAVRRIITDKDASQHDKDRAAAVLWLHWVKDMALLALLVFYSWLVYKVLQHFIVLW